MTNPESPPNITLEQAVGHHRQGRLQEAERLYRAILQSQPNHPDANHNLGVLAVQVKQPAAALPHFKAAVETDPKHGQYWLSYIETLIAAGQPDEARRALDQARRHGLSGPAADLLADRLRGGKPDEPTAEEMTALVALFASQRFADAASQARSLTERFPGHGFGWKVLGAALQQLGWHADALGPKERAAELMPDSAEAHNNLGNTLRDLGRLAEAEVRFRRALTLRSDYAEAHYNLGNTLTDLGRLEEAEVSFRRALAIVPDYALAHNNLGVSLQDQGKIDESVASFRRALEIMPEYAWAHSNLGSTFQQQGRLDPAMTSIGRAVRIKSTHRPGAAAPPVTALLAFGRSGSLFFQSLFDGHPEIATLPGVYLKGWFGMDLWTRFAPDVDDAKWRERLAKTIVREFLPLFDAGCSGNVPGRPLGDSLWLARDLGFTNMGPDQSQYFRVDQTAFEAEFLALLAARPSVDHKDCFELFHRAFESVLRGRSAALGKDHIFYHIHNPGPFDLGHFLDHYPRARLLHILRNPVQSLESWMTSCQTARPGDGPIPAGRAARKIETDRQINVWNKMVAMVAIMLTQARSPFHRSTLSRGIRLEDVKRHAASAMPRIAAWMGIADHPALYESSFGGLQYWGLPSTPAGVITGFDTKAIDRPLGRLFGPRDVLVFETLFWPLSHLYGYTDLDHQGFRRQLAEIRPWLDEALAFERTLYGALPDHSRPMASLPPYNRLHRFLHQCWTLLDRDGTYLGMVTPLDLG